MLNLFPNKEKNMIAKVFNLMSVVNTIFLVQHEVCERKCRLNENVCNSKQKWNRDKRRRKCKELDDLSSCKDAYRQNPSRCDCKFDRVSKIDEVLNIKNYSCEKVTLGNLYENVKRKY